MAITRFAAIDVGSYHVSMDIYEISPKAGIRQIDGSEAVWRSGGTHTAPGRSGMIPLRSCVPYSGISQAS